MEPLTDAELAAIAANYAFITGGTYWLDLDETEDFLAQDVPALLAEVCRLRALADEAITVAERHADCTLDNVCCSQDEIDAVKAEIAALRQQVRGGVYAQNG